MAYRVTMHNARTGKHGVFSPKHNDRNFDAENADHIDGSRSKGNVYWNWAGAGKTFEQGEREFYEKHFSEALEEQNSRYESKGQYKYCRDVASLLKSPKSCPEEVLFAVGDKDNRIGKKLLLAIVSEQLQWEMKRFPNVKYLDLALHVDEHGVEHVHARRVWIGHDKNGREKPSESQALKEMGVGLIADGTRKRNAKVFYTTECREHLEQVCRAHGLEIETERKEKGEVGLTLAAYKTSSARRELKKAQAELKQARQELTDLKADVENQREQLRQAVAGLKEVWAEERQAEQKMLTALKQAKHLTRAEKEKALKRGQEETKGKGGGFEIDR